MVRFARKGTPCCHPLPLYRPRDPQASDL